MACGDVLVCFFPLGPSLPHSLVLALVVPKTYLYLLVLTFFMYNIF